MWLKIIAAPSFLFTVDGFAGKFFPLRCGGKGFEVLERPTVPRSRRGPNDSAKIDDSLFVDLILVKQIGVIAEITQEPIQLPERSFGAVQSTRE